MASWRRRNASACWDSWHPRWHVYLDGVEVPAQPGRRIWRAGASPNVDRAWRGAFLPEHEVQHLVDEPRVQQLLRRHALTEQLLRLHADRVRITERESSLADRFRGAHPAVPVGGNQPADLDYAGYVQQDGALMQAAFAEPGGDRHPPGPHHCGAGVVRAVRRLRTLLASSALFLAGPRRVWVIVLR